MKYIHVRNLEKYHPGYKDRTLQWAKIYFKMVQGDPDCEMIENEIDWGRLIRLILLELQAQKPIPLNDQYLQKKGFNLKKRPISLTLQMLHNFISIVDLHTEDLKEVYVDKDKDKEEDKEKEKEEDTLPFWNHFLLKTQKKYTLTDERKTLIRKCLSEHSLNDLKRAVDNFVADDWAGRADNLDLIYCIGKQKGKPDNLEKWLNVEGKNKDGEKLKPGTDMPEKYFNKE